MPIRISKLRTYGKYYLFIDAVGALGFALISASAWKDIENDSFDLGGFASNIGVEIIGAWFAVRAIEFFIRKQERADRARTRLVRVGRGTLGRLHPFLGPCYARDFENHERELHYYKTMLKTWSVYLSRDEVLDLKQFMSDADAVTPLARKQVNQLVEIDRLRRVILHNIDRIPSSKNVHRLRSAIDSIFNLALQRPLDIEQHSREIKAFGQSAAAEITSSGIVEVRMVEIRKFIAKCIVENRNKARMRKLVNAANDSFFDLEANILEETEELTV